MAARAAPRRKLVAVDLVDLIAVPLFAWRGLYATSAVYIVLLGLSIDGLIQWRRAAAAPAAMPA